MAKTRRAYEGAGASSTLNGGFAAGGTTLSVAAATGWPYGSDPFFIVIEPGTANEEKLLVTRANSGDLNLTVSGSRGADGTTDVTHADGSTVYPVFTATDADEANELASTWTTKGDIVTHGASTFERLPVGTDGYVLTADSAASGGLAWGQVDTDQIATNAITADKIAADSVSSSELASNSVAATHIVDGSVDTAELAAGAVTTAKIAADAVTNAKIAAGAVDTTELATDAVTDAKIADNAVGAAQIAAGAVGTSELADDAVTNAKIADDAVGAAQIAADAVGSSEIAANAVGTSELADSSVTNAKIGADAVNGSKIADDSINSEHYVDGSIDRVHLAADIIDGTKIANDSINSEHYVDGSIDNAHIADGTITSAKVDGSILVTGSTDQSKSGKLTLTENALGNDWSTAQLILNPGGDAGISIRTGNNDNYTVQLRAGGTTASGPPRLFVIADTNPNFADVECRVLSESSARRMKTNIQPAYLPSDSDAIDKIKQIDLQSFNFIAAPDAPPVVGVIADDLEAVLPEAVTYDNDGLVSGVTTQRITYLALGALKQAVERIEQLEARIAELEG
jgi:hypothetical protein